MLKPSRICQRTSPTLRSPPSSTESTPGWSARSSRCSSFFLMTCIALEGRHRVQPLAADQPLPAARCPPSPSPQGSRPRGARRAGASPTRWSRRWPSTPPRLHPIRRSLPRAARTARALAELKKGALQPSSLGVPKNDFFIAVRWL